MMARHGLLDRPARTAAEAAALICGLQAQDVAAARLGGTRPLGEPDRRRGPHSDRQRADGRAHLADAQHDPSRPRR